MQKKNKNRLILSIGVLLAVTCLGIIYYFNIQISPRDKFEAFLVKEYRKAPSASKEKEDGKAVDQPDIAAFQDYLMTMDPATRNVPRERLFQSIDKTEKMRSLKSAGTALQWSSCPSDMAGRVRTIMYDPNDLQHKKVWAGAVTGGLWYNNDITNVNSSWVPVSDFWPCLSIRCITYDPNNPQIFYIGTGEVETAMQTYRESSSLGNGIWKSTDGGQTWSFLNSTTKFVYVPDIEVRNENGTSVIYAGIVSGLYKESQHKSLPSDGLFRSTDGGNTWTQVLPNISGSSIPYSPSDIAIGPTGRIYVGTRPNLNGDGAATILYSDSGLSGSWNVNTTYKTEIENTTDYPLPGRVAIAPSASDPNVVYALIASGFVSPTYNFRYYYCFHILRSSDKGQTWVKKNLPTKFTSGTNFATLAWHALTIGVDPNNADNVFIGGLDINRSTDGGNQWSLLSDWSKMYGSSGSSTYIHADQHAIVFKSGSSNEVLFGTDGGVFFTNNATATVPAFADHNKNFNTLQFYSAAINPTAGAVDYLGGLQDNGSLRYQGNALSRTNRVGSGDGAYCFFDENNPSLFLVSVYYNNYYIYRNGSMVALNSWSSGVFINPVDLDYKLDYLYANAVDFIGRSIDQLLRITNLNGTPLGGYVNVNTGSNVYFSSVVYSPYSPAGQTTLFLGTQAGRLFKIQDAQSTPYATVIGSTQFPTANISNIAIGGSENNLLVTFSNYGVSSVWETKDGGQTWQNKEGNLPDIPIRWALYHPNNNKQAMLATETGIWTTQNLDETVVSWKPENNGMANVRVDMIKIRKADNTVLAGTHGRGLFTTKWDVFTGTNPVQFVDIRFYPNPVKNILTITFALPNEQDITLKVTDQNGRMIYEDVKRNVNGQYRNQVNLSNKPKGIYLVSIWQNGIKLGTEKIVKF